MPISTAAFVCEYVAVLPSIADHGLKGEMTAATGTHHPPGTGDVVLMMSEHDGRMCSHMGGFVTSTLSKALNCLNPINNNINNDKDQEITIKL